MSFGFLPLPIFILVALGVAIYAFVLSAKTWNENPKPIPISLILYGLGAISGGFLRIDEELNIFVNRTSINFLTVLFLSLGFILMSIGGYLKFTEDVQKKRELLIIIFGGLFLILVLSTIAVYLYLSF